MQVQWGGGGYRELPPPNSFPHLDLAQNVACKPNWGPKYGGQKNARRGRDRGEGREGRGRGLKFRDQGEKKKSR